MKFIDVFQLTVDEFKLGMYSLKMTLSCRNMSEWSDCNDIYIVNAFICYTEWEYWFKMYGVNNSYIERQCSVLSYASEMCYVRRYIRQFWSTRLPTHTTLLILVLMNHINKRHHKIVLTVNKYYLPYRKKHAQFIGKLQWRSNYPARAAASLLTKKWRLSWVAD
jgi:hypothetical protein